MANDLKRTRDVAALEEEEGEGEGTGPSPKKARLHFSSLVRTALLDPHVSLEALTAMYDKHLPLLDEDEDYVSAFDELCDTFGTESGAADHHARLAHLMLHALEQPLPLVIRMRDMLFLLLRCTVQCHCEGGDLSLLKALLRWWTPAQSACAFDSVADRAQVIWATTIDALGQHGSDVPDERQVAVVQCIWDHFPEIRPHVNFVFFDDGAMTPSLVQWAKDHGADVQLGLLVHAADATRLLHEGTEPSRRRRQHMLDALLVAGADPTLPLGAVGGAVGSKLTLAAHLRALLPVDGEPKRSKAAVARMELVRQALGARGFRLPPTASILDLGADTATLATAMVVAQVAPDV